MIKLNAIGCAVGMSMLMLGFGLNLYTASEVATSVLLSSLMLFTLGLALASLFLIWRTAKAVAGWARSRATE